MTADRPTKEELLQIAADVWAGRRPESDLAKYGLTLGETIEGERARQKLLDELEALDSDDDASTP
jgi:hypothetical protein